MINDTNILKLIHGELDSVESARVRQEIASSADAQRLYDQYDFIYQKRGVINAIRGLDVQKDWQQIRAKLDLPSQKLFKWNSWWLALAAFVLFGVAVGMYFYLKPGPYITQRADLASMTITLPDGSTAQLEQNSQITYLRNMLADSTRRVALVGDAEFDIVANPDQPFIVETDGAGIRVLGTIFTVESQDSASVIENKEGLINCYDVTDVSNNVTLQRGDRAVWDGSSFEYIPLVPPAPPPPPGEDIRIDDFVDEITDRYPIRVEFSPYMPYDDRTIFVEMDQSLEGIMSQLDTSATIDFQQIGRRFLINSLGPK